MSNLPQLLRELSIFNSIDLHFANFINQQSNEPDDELYLAAALCSYFTNEKHTAFDLYKYAGMMLIELLPIDTETKISDEASAIKLPDSDSWKKLLLSKSTIVGSESERKPLILSEDGLLYLHRYFNYEASVAGAISRRTDSVDIDLAKVSARMQKLFPKGQGHDIDWQEVAAFAALRSKFCVISGGPGTGKTTTVAKVLALLLDINPTLEVSLVAPTGKAADRLGKSIQRVKASLDFNSGVVNLIPESAITIHRFLGYIPNSTNFRFNEKNKKTTQLLLVDEASMVSLPMFAKLFSALQNDCRVILLGDKDQLSAVETGNVLGDISNAEHINMFSNDFGEAYEKVSASSEKPESLPTVSSSSALENSVVKLMFSHRFGSDSGIGTLSSLVNAGNWDESIKLLTEKNEFNDINLSSLPEASGLTKALSEMVKKGRNGLAGYQNYIQAVKSGDPKVILDAFEQFQILCAVHGGHYGVENINQLIEQILFPQTRELNYPGKAVMITVNDHSRGLYNGDVGIIAADETGDLKAYFPDSDGELRQFSPALLPEHVLAYAMTVHKSQGSEFDDVLLIMPDRQCNVLTKEIVYTGITRAKKNVAIWSSQTVLKNSVETSTIRTSGLKKRLTS